MSTPYYEDDLVTLYLGNCMEVDAWLGADVLVTDPPYGMAYQSNRSKYDGPSAAIRGDGDTSVRDEALAAWGARPAIVFGTWRQPKPVTTRHTGIWDKGDDPGTGDLTLPWGNSHEEFYILGTGFVGKRGPAVIRCNKPAISTRFGHPTPKPVALMERLIANTTGVVADPFAGSGSTLVAAKGLGRKAVGVELEERYCEIIATRCAQDALDFGSAS